MCKNVELMSVREYDEYCENIMSEFLLKNFYNTLNPKSIQKINDKNLQIKGVDIILNLNDKIYYIDEKAAIRYVNLKTFALELSFIDKKGNTKIGWLLDKNKINDYFLFVWINELYDDKIYNINSIKNVDVALVNKSKIFSYLNSIGWTVENLYNKNNNIRNKNDNRMGNIKKNKCKFSYSINLKEKPINILLPKETYINIADIYKNIIIDIN